jgi:hypothetical protein
MDSSSGSEGDERSKAGELFNVVLLSINPALMEFAFNFPEE